MFEKIEKFMDQDIWARPNCEGELEFAASLPREGLSMEPASATHIDLDALKDCIREDFEDTIIDIVREKSLWALDEICEWNLIMGDARRFASGRIGDEEFILSRDDGRWVVSWT